jgi:hypothetical protein
MKIYDITLIGKPRMTRADQMAQPAETSAYWFFKARAPSRITLPESGAHITFVMPMPPSWSKKKREQQRQAAPVKTRLRQHA